MAVKNLNICHPHKHYIIFLTFFVYMFQLLRCGRDSVTSEQLTSEIGNRRVGKQQRKWQIASSGWRIKWSLSYRTASQRKEKAVERLVSWNIKLLIKSFVSACITASTCTIPWLRDNSANTSVYYATRKVPRYTYVKPGTWKNSLEWSTDF